MCTLDKPLKAHVTIVMQHSELISPPMPVLQPLIGLQCREARYALLWVYTVCLVVWQLQLVTFFFY